jgi:hypothetical protein
VDAAAVAVGVAKSAGSGRAFTLPTVSAGSGTAGLDSVAVVSSSAISAISTAATSAIPAGAAVAASPEPEESPSASAVRCDAAERVLAVLFRDDDMMPLSTIASAASPSGSAFRLAGAMMSGD